MLVYTFDDNNVIYFDKHNVTHIYFIYCREFINSLNEGVLQAITIYQSSN